eukprot:scaffold1138_cov128-Cylindrotheca_fusiformis.AAC.3
MTSSVASRRVAILTVLASLFLQCSCTFETAETNLPKSTSPAHNRKRVLKRHSGQRHHRDLVNNRAVNQYGDMLENGDFSLSLDPTITLQSKSSKKSKRQSYDVPLRGFQLSHALSDESKQSPADSRSSHLSASASVHFGGINLNHKPISSTEAKQTHFYAEKGTVLENQASWVSAVPKSSPQSAEGGMALQLQPFALEYRLDEPETPDINDFAEIEEITRLFIEARIEESLQQQSLVITEDSFAEFDSRRHICISFSPQVIFDSGIDNMTTVEELDMIVVEGFLGRSMMEYITVLQSLDSTNAFSATTTVFFNRTIDPLSNETHSSSIDSTIAGISAGAITLVVLSVWAVSMRKKHEKRFGRLKDIHQDTLTSDVVSLRQNSGPEDEEEGLQKHMAHSITVAEGDGIGSDIDDYSYSDEGSGVWSSSCSHLYPLQGSKFHDTFSLAESFSSESGDPLCCGPNQEKDLARIIVEERHGVGSDSDDCSYSDESSGVSSFSCKISYPRRQENKKQPNLTLPSSGSFSLAESVFLESDVPNHDEDLETITIEEGDGVGSDSDDYEYSDEGSGIRSSSCKILYLDQGNKKEPKVSLPSSGSQSLDDRFDSFESEDPLCLVPNQEEDLESNSDMNPVHDRAFPSHRTSSKDSQLLKKSHHSICSSPAFRSLGDTLCLPGSFVSKDPIASESNGNKDLLENESKGLSWGRRSRTARLPVPKQKNSRTKLYFWLLAQEQEAVLPETMDEDGQVLSGSEASPMTEIDRRCGTSSSKEQEVARGEKIRFDRKLKVDDSKQMTKPQRCIGFGEQRSLRGNSDPETSNQSTRIHEVDQLSLRKRVIEKTTDALEGVCSPTSPKNSATDIHKEEDSDFSGLHIFDDGPSQSETDDETEEVFFTEQNNTILEWGIDEGQDLGKHYTDDLKQVLLDLRPSFESLHKQLDPQTLNDRTAILESASETETYECVIHDRVDRFSLRKRMIEKTTEVLEGVRSTASSASSATDICKEHNSSFSGLHLFQGGPSQNDLDDETGDEEQNNTVLERDSDERPERRKHYTDDLKQALLDLRPSFESLPAQLDVECTSDGPFNKMRPQTSQREEESLDPRNEEQKARVGKQTDALLLEEMQGRLDSRERAKPHVDCSAVESSCERQVHSEGKMMLEPKEAPKHSEVGTSNNVPLKSAQSSPDETSHSEFSLQEAQDPAINGTDSKLAKYPWNKMKDSRKDKEKFPRPSAVVDFIAPGCTPTSNGSDLQSRYKDDIVKDRRGKLEEEEQSIGSLPSYKARLPVTMAKKAENVPWWLPDESTCSASKSSAKRSSTIWEDETDDRSQASCEDSVTSASSSYFSETPSSISSPLWKPLS